MYILLVFTCCTMDPPDLPRGAPTTSTAALPELRLVGSVIYVVRMHKTYTK